MISIPLKYLFVYRQLSKCFQLSVDVSLLQACDGNDTIC